jgi:hypothetical protein
VAGPTTPAQRVFAGNEKYQTEMREKGDLESVIQGLDPQKDGDLIQAMRLRQGGAIPSVPTSLVEPPPSLRFFDEASGKLSGPTEVARNTEVVTRSRPPQIMPSFQQGGTDPKDGTGLVFDARAGKFIDSNVDIGPKPSANGSNGRIQQLVPPNMYNTYSQLIRSTGPNVSQAVAQQANSIVSTSMRNMATPRAAQILFDANRKIVEKRNRGEQTDLNLALQVIRQQVPDLTEPELVDIQSM